MRERRKDEDREMERVGLTIGYLKKILLEISTMSSIRNQNLCACVHHSLDAICCHCK